MTLARVIFTRKIMYMNNSIFFREAAIVANEALKYKDPMGKGIKLGLGRLKLKRSANNPEFSDPLFTVHAIHYERIARGLVREYLDYKDAMLRTKAYYADN
jgi:hypothetical protein